MFENIFGNSNIGEYINNITNTTNEQDGSLLFINDTNSFSENCRRAEFCLNKLDGVFIALNSFYLDIIPSNTSASIQIDITSNQTEEANNKICKYINRLLKLKEIINVIKSSFDVLVQVIDWSIKNIKETIAKIILVKCQIFILKSKKFLSITEEHALLGIRSVVIGMSLMKGSKSSTILNGSIELLLNTLKTLNIGISYVALAIKTTLDMIPNNFSITPEKICFFATPKSMSKTLCNILNVNNSASDRIPDSVKNALSSLELSQALENKTIKTSIIAAGAAAGLASAYSNFKVPSSICNLIKIANTNKINTSISNILRYLPESYSLPKYEELLPIVQGYMKWLITGFVPAGHKSFGIPGFP